MSARVFHCQFAVCGNKLKVENNKIITFIVFVTDSFKNKLKNPNRFIKVRLRSK